MDRLRFGYRRSHIIWSATTEDECIVVDDPLYEHILHEQLKAQGITLQAHNEIMRPAQEVWERQCEAVKRIQHDLTLWKSIPGVEVYRL